MNRYLATGLFALSLVARLDQGNSASAEDWPQWRGPNRDGVWNEKGLVSEFPQKGMVPKWKVPVNLGYSGPVVVDGRVFLSEFVKESGEVVNDGNNRKELEGNERIVCFNAETGEQIWDHSYPCKYKIGYPSGPRATPCIHDGKVYVLGAEGHLNCFDTASGRVHWAKDLRTEYKTKTPIWGFCGSPVISGNILICLVGGQGSVAVGFDKDTGAELWRSLTTADTGYSPPTVIEAGGVRQVIVWHTQEINSLNPDTGEVYWSLPLKAPYTMAIMMPQKHGDYLYASAPGGAAALLKLDSTKPAAEIAWRGRNDNALYSSNSTPIVDDTGTMYGADSGGMLRAIELESGKRLWETASPTTGNRRGAHGTAHIVRNGDRYILFSETGDLILARMSAKEYIEIGRFHLIDPTGDYSGRDVAWSHPAFANKCVFARSDKELVCVSLAAE